MRNKVKIIIFSICLVFLGLYFLNFKDNHEIIYNKIPPKVINTNTLTMMYETESSSGEYEVSSDTSWPQDGYIFNERLSGCENGSILTWDDENKRVLLQTNTSDKCYVYFDKKPDIVYLADYIKGLYTSDGENGIYLHDGVGSYTNADQEAGDNSYRYAGANPNNYVCFGSDAASCPNDNLYRIIGVFDNRVKLIKYDYANSNLLGTNGDYSSETNSSANSSYYKGGLTTINKYYWNFSDGYNSQNIWNESNLNKINLNTNYLNNIGSTWSSKIATTSWKVGGNVDENIENVQVKTAYTNEIVNPAEPTIYNAKIGLMYVSDYYYSAASIYWLYFGYSNGDGYDYRKATNSNWMYMGLREWTITPSTDYTHDAFVIESLGYVFSYGGDGLDYPYSIRPTFYLKPEVTYASGDGTQNSPFKIECTTCTSN